MHPSGFTATFPPFNSIAADPSGHLSTQIVHESPSVRRQVAECQTAVPISISLIEVGRSAPLGQTDIHFNPVHTAHAEESASIYGTPPAFVASNLIACTGQTFTHSPFRVQV